MGPDVVHLIHAGIGDLRADEPRGHLVGRERAVGIDRPQPPMRWKGTGAVLVGGLVLAGVVLRSRR